MWGSDDGAGRAGGGTSSSGARSTSPFSSAGIARSGQAAGSQEPRARREQPHRLNEDALISDDAMPWPGTAHDGRNSEQEQDEEWSDAPVFHFPGATPEIITEAWYRVQARQLIREFLRSVPRSEPEATLAIIRADGTQRLLTRGQLTEAIERLRPRQRQIVRLAVEERWPRQRVCSYLHDISIKTFERDQIEALDTLAQL